MFRLIPLRTAAHTVTHRVDIAVPIFDTVEREIHAPNYTTPGYRDKSSAMTSWNMYPTKSNLLMITSGKVELDIYCLQERKHESFVLTPDDVYRNGKVYYGSPAMVGWAPGIFYKLRTGTDGASFVNFMKKHDDLESVNDEFEYMVA